MPHDPEPFTRLIRQGPTCPECHRCFDLLDEDDAAEWTYGHDCESE
jgi:hypothetical protein